MKIFVGNKYEADSKTPETECKYKGKKNNFEHWVIRSIVSMNHYCIEKSKEKQW